MAVLGRAWDNILSLCCELIFLTPLSFPNALCRLHKATYSSEIATSNRAWDRHAVHGRRHGSDDSFVGQLDKAKLRGNPPEG